jgi:flagellar basal-body rod modification protein FlgD
MSTVYSSNSATSGPASADQSTNPNSTITQSQFLQLLVTQMTQQDPLNPESDSDFAAQLAQFSTLQQTTNVATGMQTLQADSLIGQTVNVTPSSGSINATTGVVTGVDLSDSDGPQIVVNGQLYSLSQINSITPTQTPATDNTSGAATENVKP